MPDPTRQLSTPVRTEQVAYRYPNCEFGLEETSLDFKAGQFIHIQGPSGSGKSTLARCLTGLIPHLYHGELTGEVWLNGSRTTDSELWELAEKVGMVYQNPDTQMLGATVEDEIIFGLENLGFSTELIDERLEEVLEQFSLTGMRRRSPMTLSGGERQKLALAAMIARKPGILVLDEPLSMLDVTAATELIEALIRLRNQGMTIILFEHRAAYLNDVPDIRRIQLNGKHALPTLLEESQLTFLPEDREICLAAQSVCVELGGKPVIKDLNFKAMGGESVAIVGRNGSGKTTLLRALSGLQLYEGKIDVNGEAPHFGIVFQNADLQLFNPSVREEMTYKLDDYDEELYTELLKVLALTRYEDSPTLLLSEGEKKRVALATILLQQPEHGVLLDEPSLGQDELHKEMLLRVVHALNRSGRLVIITTHDLGLAAGADRIVLLHEGQVYADGPASGILADDTSWQAIGLHIPDWFREGRHR